MKACREFSFLSLTSFLTGLRFGFSSIQKLPLLNSSVMSRSSKWDSVLYSLDRDAYLTCHTINTISSSYLALWDPDWGLSPKSFEEASHLLQRGLAAGESSDRAEPIQTRKNNSKIPVAQWLESKRLSARRDERWRARKDAAERSQTFIIS